ncbi:hypothetical protein [Sinorhizobium meliloti]|uniref:hypothetical protein n=1 Tax=Rhizobium meliloti TaxID=382 RepID=UPI001F1B4D44|nr:hypothetical protein [Sinorhizobium meliloti]
MIVFMRCSLLEGRRFWKLRPGQIPVSIDATHCAALRRELGAGQGLAFKIQQNMISEISWELRIDASSGITKLPPQAGEVDCASARFSEIGYRHSVHLIVVALSHTSMVQAVTPPRLRDTNDSISLVAKL